MARGVIRALAIGGEGTDMQPNGRSAGSTVVGAAFSCFQHAPWLPGSLGRSGLCVDGRENESSTSGSSIAGRLLTKADSLKAIAHLAATSSLRRLTH